MDLREKRALYNGFGDTLTRAVEFVAIPGLFALIGAFLDDWFGTGPLLTVGLAVFALTGVFVRAYFAYELAMQEQEANLPWKVGPAPPPEHPS
ncbi:MAG: AtpZ/AtpI family protein [Acidimicrobiales bacterium]